MRELCKVRANGGVMQGFLLMQQRGGFVMEVKRSVLKFLVSSE